MCYLSTGLSYLPYFPCLMDEFGSSRFEGIGSTTKKRRSQTSRRRRPEPQLVPEDQDESPSSSTPFSHDASDEITGCDENSRRKVFNLSQCASRSLLAARTETECADYGASNLQQSNNEGLEDETEQGQNGLNHKIDVAGNENKLKKVKLKVGGVTRTIQTKSSSRGATSIGLSTKNDVSRPRPKLIIQDDSDEDQCDPPNRSSGLKGIPWKDFSKGSFSLGKEDSSLVNMAERNASGKHGEKSEAVRKSKRVPKKRVLDGAFDEDYEDDEIRYLEKLKTSKVAALYRDIDEESGKKRKSPKVVKAGKYENLECTDPSRLTKYGSNFKSERSFEHTDSEEEEVTSDHETNGEKKKKLRKDLPDSPIESKREMTLTTRQRTLLSGKNASSAPGTSLIEFPNGLPPPPPRKQKEKLSEVEQQLKKTEAAQRRKLQNEMAARESEAEAIRKILGQDSNRKKREDKLKKRQEELAQEKAAKAQTLEANTIRWVMGPGGTVVTFSEDMGLPQIFDSKSSSYPPPREKCAGPYCTNPYKYRDSKSKLPLCSLECYKALHEKMTSEALC